MGRALGKSLWGADLFSPLNVLYSLFTAFKLRNYNSLAITLRKTAIVAH